MMHEASPSALDAQAAIQARMLVFAQRYWAFNLIFHSLCLLVAAMSLSLDNAGVAAGEGVLSWLLGATLALLVCYLLRWQAVRSKRSVDAKLRVFFMLTLVESCAYASVLYWFAHGSVVSQVLLVLLMFAALINCIMVTAGYRLFYFAFSVPIALGLMWVALFGEFATSARAADNAVEYYAYLSLGLVLLGLLQRLANHVYANIRDSLSANYHNKQINQNLKAAVLAAKKANESKTRFLASASHDLRQPINSLALFIASLKLQTATPAQADIVAAMAEAIESIDSQLESLLDISKLDAGIVEVHSRTFNLVDFMARVLSAYQPAALAADVPVRFDCAPLQLMVRTDPVLFDRVVRNLVGNAIKYTPTGDIRISITQRNGQAVVGVTDSGVGISPEHLHKVFDEFYQVDNPQRDAQRGLGLGLSIVHRLCQLLELNIAFRSNLGVGTQVQLFVPLSEQASTTSPTKQKGYGHGRALNILVLDNEPSILMAMDSVLRRMGHNATTVESADEALLAFNQVRYDIALVDYRLPGAASGLDIIAQFTQLDPRVKCFLVTGDSNIKRDLSAVEIIYKPLTANKLQHIFNPS